MTSRLPGRLFLWSLSALLAGVLSAVDALADREPVLELPKYTVTNQLLLPKPESWRYAKIPGFEVLSCASPTETRYFLRDFQQLQQVIDIVWPALCQAAPPVPGTLVIYDGGRAPDLLEATVKAVGDEIIDLETLEPVAGGVASAFFSNQEAVCIVIDLHRQDAGEQFYRAYVSHLFSRMDAPMAPWLKEGTARLFAGVDFSTKWIKFGAIDSGRFGEFTTRLGRQQPPSLQTGSTRLSAVNTGDARGEGATVATATSNLRSQDIMGGFPSLAEMLQADEAGIQTRNLPYLAHAFVHMCLYGRGQRFQKPFLIYLARTNGGSGSEEVFRETFGMSIKAMEEEIVSYVSWADYKTVTFRAEKGQPVLATPPEVGLRSATQAEVGRIKGDGLVLAGRTDTARVAYLAPYIRGEHDADLLAALGLYELDAGRPERVRNFLELASRGGTKRPRAYLELARLRSAGHAPAGDRRPETPSEAVIGPLRVAASLEPPMIEVYEMLAKEWLECSTPPPASDLALLEKGAVRFQRKLKLVYDTARLLAVAGSNQKATRLAGWGAQNAFAPADRERFAQLLATLPPVPAATR